MVSHTMSYTEIVITNTHTITNSDCILVYLWLQWPSPDTAVTQHDRLDID